MRRAGWIAGALAVTYGAAVWGWRVGYRYLMPHAPRPGFTRWTRERGSTRGL